MAYQDHDQSRRQRILDRIGSLKSKALVCWCAPLCCHGDVLAAMADDDKTGAVAPGRMEDRR